MIKKQTVIMTIRIFFAGVLLTWGGWTLYQSTRPQIDKQAPSEQTKNEVAGQPTKRTEEERAAYAAPAEHPRHITIPSLGISAVVLPMSTTVQDAIEAPASAWDVGWYNQSALPGSANGAMILDGHVNDTLNGAGVFYSISRLTATDTITIEKGDLEQIQYRVTSVEQLPYEKVSIDGLMRAPAGGLHLITCGGQYNEARKTYDDRVIVTAVRI